MVARLLAVLLALSGAGATTAPRPRPLPDAWQGVTLERVAPLGPIVSALAAHRHRPFVRVVLQADRGPRAYVAPVAAIRRHAWVMGELLDSDDVRRTSVAQVRERARRYVATLGGRVDLWEVGNELNGAWLGRPHDIDAKAAAAYDVVHATGARTAITLNYWPSHDCYAHPWERTLPFARQLPQRIRSGVDVVLLSFYETACSPAARPTVDDFAHVLTRLEGVFPHARVGIGEIGAQRAADGVPNPSLAEKERIARTYYGMQRPLAARLGHRFVGGWFWWYYAQDAVPRDRPGSLWPTLEQLFDAY